MANYFKDIPELKFHLNNPLMKRICELKERDYRDKDQYDYAPIDFEDAMDNYEMVLEQGAPAAGSSGRRSRYRCLHEQG